MKKLLEFSFQDNFASPLYCKLYFLLSNSNQNVNRRVKNRNFNILFHFFKPSLISHHLSQDAGRSASEISPPVPWLTVERWKCWLWCAPLLVSWSLHLQHHIETWTQEDNQNMLCFWMLGVNYEHQILNPKTQFPNMEMDPNLNPNSKNFNTKNSTIHFYIWHSGFWILDSGFIINIYYTLQRRSVITTMNAKPAKLARTMKMVCSSRLGPTWLPGGLTNTRSLPS